jgi:hypothetical protein
LGVLSATQQGSVAGTSFSEYSRNLLKAGEALNLDLFDDKGRAIPLVEQLDIFQERFGDLKVDSAQKMAAIEKAFGSKPAASALKGMLNSIEQVRENAGLLAQDTGMQTVNEMAQAIASPWDRISSSAKNLTISFGAALLPVIEPVVDGLASVLGYLALLADEHQFLTGIIGAAVVGFITLIAVYNAAKVAIGLYKLATLGLNIAQSASIAKTYALIAAHYAARGAMLLLSGALTVVRGAVWLFNAALLANPIGLIVGAVALLIAGVGALILYWDQAKAALMDIAPINMLVNGIKKVVGWIAELAQWLGIIDGKSAAVNVEQTTLNKTLNESAGTSAVSSVGIAAHPRAAANLPTLATNSSVKNIGEYDSKLTRVFDTDVTKIKLAEQLTKTSLSQRDTHTALASLTQNSSIANASTQLTQYSESIKTLEQKTGQSLTSATLSEQLERISERYNSVSTSADFTKLTHDMGSEQAARTAVALLNEQHKISNVEQLSTSDKSQALESLTATNQQRVSNVEQLNASAKNQSLESVATATNQQRVSNVEQLNASAKNQSLESVATATNQQRVSNVEQLNASAKNQTFESATTAANKHVSNVVQLHASAKNQTLESLTATTNQQRVSNVEQLNASAKNQTFESLTAATNQQRVSNVEQLNASAKNQKFESATTAANKHVSNVVQLHASAKNKTLESLTATTNQRVNNVEQLNASAKSSTLESLDATKNQRVNNVLQFSKHDKNSAFESLTEQSQKSENSSETSESQSISDYVKSRAQAAQNEIKNQRAESSSSTTNNSTDNSQNNQMYVDQLIVKADDPDSLFNQMLDLVG